MGHASGLPQRLMETHTGSGCGADVSIISRTELGLSSLREAELLASDSAATAECEMRQQQLCSRW